MSTLKKFKAPRKLANVAPSQTQTQIEVEEDSSLDTTEEQSMEDDNCHEEILRDECKTWLALHGKALYSLELSKHLAKEKKSHNVKPVLSRNRGVVSPMAIGE